MKEKVYVETSVISYLTSRPSRDIVIAGHQQITQEWWQNYRETFDLVASQLVIQEASAGDSIAAEQRLKILEKIELLATTEDALSLSQAFLDLKIMPQKAAEDALHIAIAVTNGINYLLTWNCKHIANAIIRREIERICRSKGYEPVIICTPEELIER
ncbi:type II toxin-antitoxin system VapC family toxin [Anabaena cylindrica UHCC 0172]|uniref:type II toxin-antitoxin system VapC family toxin n=1 Tax=Anabaena cylindrica TaxID=1165 RepID=UPI002B1F6D88|nr:type II toxin-antitoxin system VapC family toxin [Anabaena cylindrica]MEA5554666.1 type II toxin-antitoxin system VapC family toxin [Anabaena cylindrica UHCC 0172]